VKQVDFFLHSEHEIANFAPIVAALRSRGVDARWVIEPPGSNVAAASVRGQVVMHMNEANFDAISQRLLDAGEVPLFRLRYETAHAVVTTGGSSWLGQHRGVRIRCAYGVAAMHDSINWTSANENFHALITHGQHSAKHISHWVPQGKTIITGYPKYAPYFRDGLDTQAWKDKWQLDPSKPTIAYFSTWEASSALPRFAHAIAGLAQHYNVVYKPHHNNLRFERDEYELLRNTPGLVVDEDTRTIIPFYDVADLVIADVRSGSFTEAFLVDKPVIGLSALGSAKTDNLIDGIEDAAYVCRQPELLLSAVAEELAHDTRGPARQSFRELFFSDHDSNDDYVAADEILKLINASGLGDTELPALGSECQASIIVADNSTTTKLLWCLNALNYSDASLGGFEVIVASSNAHLEPVIHNAGASLRYSVRFVHNIAGTNYAVVDATKLASAPLTLFLDGDSIPTQHTIHYHCAAHAIGTGTQIAVLGRRTFSMPEPKSALSRVVESSGTVEARNACKDGEHLGWRHARLDNFSVPTALCQGIDLDNADATNSIALAMHIGLELQRRGCEVVFDQLSATLKTTEPTLDDIRRQKHTEAKALITVLSHFEEPWTEHDLAGLAHKSFADLDNEVARVMPVSGYLMSVASDLAEPRPTQIAAVDQSFAALGQNIEQALGVLLTNLVEHWTKEGLRTGLQCAGVDGFAQLHERITAPKQAWPLSTSAEQIYFAWPDWSSRDELDTLMVFARANIAGNDACLCLRHDPSSDGDVQQATSLLEAAYKRHLSDDSDLEILLLTSPMHQTDASPLGRSVSHVVDLPSRTTSARSKFIQNMNSPLISALETTGNTLETSLSKGAR
jgi:hypothetical protein